MMINLGTFLVAVTLKFISVSGSEKLGCNYVNNRYELPNGPVQDPVYGSAPMSVSFSSKDQAIQLLTEMTALCEQYVRERPFNTLDDYLDFYNEYKKSTHPDFATFFKSYKAKYETLSGFFGLAIDLLVTTTAKNGHISPNMKRSVFLAAAQYDIPLDDADLHNMESNFVNSTMRRRINHVFAVLKFSINNKDKGYFLFDPTFSLVKPILVMEDGQTKLPGDSVVRNKDEKNNIVYEIVKSNSNFIVGRYEGDQKPQFLIYVGHAYCSVLDITEKLELLRYDRYFIRRDKDGWGTGGLYFNALPELYAKENNIDRNTLTLFLTANSSTEPNVKKLNFSSFETLKSAESSQFRIRFYYQRLASQLKMTAKNLNTKLVNVHKILNDDTFLTNVYKTLLNVYRKSDEQSKDQVISQITQITSR